MCQKKRTVEDAYCFCLTSIFSENINSRTWQLKKMVVASQDQPRLEATMFRRMKMFSTHNKNVQADKNVQHPLVPGLARQF